jgi:hypothetical protein
VLSSSCVPRLAAALSLVLFLLPSPEASFLHQYRHGFRIFRRGEDERGQLTCRACQKTVSTGGQKRIHLKGIGNNSRRWVENFLNRAKDAEPSVVCTWCANILVVLPFPSFSTSFCSLCASMQNVAYCLRSGLLPSSAPRYSHGYPHCWCTRTCHWRNAAREQPRLHPHCTDIVEPMHLMPLPAVFLLSPFPLSPSLPACFSSLFAQPLSLYVFR